MLKSTVENRVEIYNTTLKIRTNDTFSEVDLGNFASGVIREWFFADLCCEVQKVLEVKIRSFNLLPSDVREPGCLNLASFVHDSIRDLVEAKKLAKWKIEACLHGY